MAKHHVQFLVLAAVAITFPVAAQTQTERTGPRYVDIGEGSGELTNFDKIGPATLYSHSIRIPDENTASMRLHFDGVRLEGASYVKITSLADGDVQTLNAEEMDVWENSTAYFNGKEVLVELVGAPGTTNSLRVAKVEIPDLADETAAAKPGIHCAVVLRGAPGKEKPESVCAQVDTRASDFGSAETNKTARLLPAPPCTGFLTICPANPNRQIFLSAGHCFTGPNPVRLAQFAVPANSNANCNLTHPPAANQFTIIPGTIQFQAGGRGADWAVFNVMRSGANNSQTPFDQRGDAWTLFPNMVTAGTAAVVGYGSDGGNNATPAAGDTTQNFCSACVPNNPNGTSVLNSVPQRADGAVTGVTTAMAGGRIQNSRVAHNISTCGGNSGSPIFRRITRTGVLPINGVIGIHTSGGCAGFTATNTGTGINHSTLQDAITFGCSVCDINGDGKVNAADLTLVQKGFGQAPAAMDRRDANRDGVINIQDLRICSLLCTNKNCQ